MTTAKSKAKQKPKPRNDDRILVAECLGAFEQCNGDIDAAHKLIKKKVDKRTFKRFVKDYFFDIRLKQNQEEILEKVMEDAKERQLEMIRTLRNARLRTYYSIMGRMNDAGTAYLDKPVPAKSLEGAVDALVKLIGMEREVHGDRSHTGQEAANLLVFAAQALAGGPIQQTRRDSPFDVDEGRATKQ